uniref:Uncharacterized protein n=1 Tax=Magallana gigas TaxID=29159 RepID=K1QR01_MAGGI
MEQKDDESTSSASRPPIPVLPTSTTKKRVSSTVHPFVTSKNAEIKPGSADYSSQPQSTLSPAQCNNEIKPRSTDYSSPPPSTVSPTQQLQSSPIQMAQCNPYFPITSPTSPYQYVMYPNQWNSMNDVYGNGYPMYPTNSTTSSTAPACAANPPLPLDSPSKNPPLL